MPKPKQANGWGDLKLPDNEALLLFLNFYKLLFLGSKFARKMLKIKIEKSYNSKGQSQIDIEKSLATAGITTDEESKKSDFFIDTSDYIVSESTEALYHEGE